MSGGTALRRDERRTALALLAPAVLLIVTVALLPVLYTIYLSVHDASCVNQRVA